VFVSSSTLTSHQVLARLMAAPVPVDFITPTISKQQPIASGGTGYPAAGEFAEKYVLQPPSEAPC
jgi:hypothetical protein